MTYPKETKKARLNQLHAKKYNVAAQLEKDPENIYLQEELNTINAKISRLQYRTAEMEKQSYRSLDGNDELEL